MTKNKGADIKGLTKKIIAFRDARDWKQFHNPKDLAISLVLEAGEVMEHFQWKNEKEIAKHIAENKTAISEELADTLYWILLMSHDLDIDILKAVENKMIQNEAKYPIAKARGKHTKYNRL
jgi:NTP pyrophosphatase (non-canonical NTP hydrolase)